MPRAGLSTESVVQAAAELADAEGLQAATLAALAARLGVRPPSLYAHVEGVEDLRERIALRGIRQLGEAMQLAAAGRAGHEALAAIAAAYRSYAHEHPGCYAALQRSRSPEAQAAATRVVEVVLAVLAGYGLQGEDALHAVRAIRAALHGFVSLEAAQGFGLPLPVDESFARMVEMLDRALAVAA